MGPSQDRPFIEAEFVGREEPLGGLLKVARLESAKRILVVVAPFGVGKSWLLQKLKADRDEAGVELVLIDFGAPPMGHVEWGYLDVVEAVREQLGGTELDGLAASVDAVRKEAAGLGLADPFATQLGGALPAAAENAGGNQYEVTAGDVGAEAQVAVGSGITMAQRDVNYVVVNQMSQRTDASVQQHYQTRITAAFESALKAVTATRKVVFVFDAWLKAGTPTRDWLCRTLVTWIRDQSLGGVAVVVADDAAVPELQQRHPLLHALPLTPLTEDEIVTYWVEKRGLDPAKASWVTQACLGHPLTLAMIADLHDMAGGL
jgi:hypothetical protein